ncbi:MAG: hypothetical protein ACK4UQ_06570 [Brevundimonas sp.]
MKRVLKLLEGVVDVSVCFVKKTWRPTICFMMGLILMTNGVIIPLMNRQVPDLIGLAALVATLTPFAWLRTVEKQSGVAD